MKFAYTSEQWERIEACAPGIWRDALEATVSEYLMMLTGTPLEWDKIRETAEALNRLLSDLGADDRHGVEHVPGALNDLIAKAASNSQAHGLRWHRDMLRSNAIKPADIPRRQYYDMLIRLWCEWGGNLGVSNDRETQKPAGPLVRFFAAVTGPVMGDDAPAASSIAGIVRDYRKRHHRD